MRALDLARQGWKQRDIAVALDASEGAVSRWLAAARRGGPEALRSHPGPGPSAKLTPGQFRLVPDFLWHGAEAYGYRGDVWTCERVAGVIGEEFGVEVVTRVLRTRGAEQAVLEEALRRETQLIVLGVSPRRHLGLSLIGRTNERIMRRSPVRVLVVRERDDYILPGRVVPK